MTVSAVVFDWGGTLSVFADIDLSDMWRLAARHLAPDAEDELCERLLAIEHASFARAHTDQRATALPEILAEASRALGLDVAEAVLEEAALHHLDSWTPHIVHDPDAAPTLQALKGRGIRTALLSNTHWPRSFHEHFLERDGLVDLIDARLYTSEMTHMKPHRRAFEEALEAIGVDDPATAVFVGDREYDDVWGAAQVGMRAVWRRNAFVERHPEAEPSAVIDRLPELLDLVDAWSGPREG